MRLFDTASLPSSSPTMGDGSLIQNRLRSKCWPAVIDRVAGRIPILFDSGIRRGTDIVSGLAYGASCGTDRTPVYLWTQRFPVPTACVAS